MPHLLKKIFLFQNLIGMLGSKKTLSDQLSQDLFQNLIGMLGSYTAHGEKNKIKMFQNLIGMLGSLILMLN